MPHASHMHALRRIVFTFVLWVIFTGGPTAGLAKSPDANGYLDSDSDGFSNYLEQLFGTDPLDAESHPTLADNHDLIKAYWPLLTDAQDHLGRGHDNDGEIKGGAKFSAEGLSLNGRDAYVDFGNGASLSASNGIAWSVWVKPDDKCGLSRILGKFKSGGDQQEYACFALAGRVWVSISDNGSARRGHSILAVTTKAVLEKRRWVHLVASWESGGLIDIYVDGEQQRTLNIGCKRISSLHSGEAPLTLGAYDVPEEKHAKKKEKKIVIKNAFKGKIAGLTLFDHGLTELEVRELWVLGTQGDLLSYIGMDFDRDGLPDWWERLLLGDIASLATDDSDGDGLTNLEEFEQGLDPNTPDNPDDDDGDGDVGGDKDSDGDGLTDDEEALLGMDPYTPFTIVPREAMGLKLFTTLR